MGVRQLGKFCNLIGYGNCATAISSDPGGRSTPHPSGSRLHSSVLLRPSERARSTPHPCAGIECGHSAMRELVLVADFRISVRKFWKNATSCGMVLRSAESSWILDHEIDQRGHVIQRPSSIQAVIAQIEKKFLHLISQRVRLHECHALM